MTWWEWIASRARAWVGYALGLAALIGLGASAYVGATGPDPIGPDRAAAAQEAQGEANGHAVENHGRCVSAAAHAAKEAGLRGRDKGAFMSSVAKDESQVANKAGEGSCRFGGALNDALDSQAARPEKGKPDDAGAEANAERGKPAKPEKPEKPAEPTDEEPAPEDEPPVEIPEL